MMVQVGVRTITVGGRPEQGPIQAAAGSRGAALYDADTLDNDFQSTLRFNPAVRGSIPQERDPGMFVNFASFSLRDQVRANDSVPLQFQFLAADCRLYWTLDNVFNMSRLWRDVARAAWTDRSMCVPDSTGYVNTYDMVYKPPAPVATAAATPSAGLAAAVRSGTARLVVSAADRADTNRFDGHILLDGSPKTSSKTLRACNPDKASSDCPGGVACILAKPVTCPSGRINSTMHVCALKCNNSGTKCGSSTATCRFTSSTKDRGKATFGTSLKNPGSNQANAVRAGNCQPRVGTRLLGCPFAGDLVPAKEEEEEE